jgi:hypothetical protein
LEHVLHDLSLGENAPPDVGCAMVAQLGSVRLLQLLEGLQEVVDVDFGSVWNRSAI